MQNTFMQIKDGQIIFDQAQLTMYLIAAVVVIVVVILVIVAIKKRKKDFIKTVPTNLKDGE